MRRRHPRAVLCWALPALLAGCLAGPTSDEGAEQGTEIESSEWTRPDTGKADSIGAQSSTNPRSFAAYNVGLAHGAVALAWQRRGPIFEALAELPVDVLCVNEVWTDDDFNTMRTALAQSFPHSFRQRTVDNSWRKIHCSPWGAYKLDSCVSAQCTPKGISAEECVLNACKTEYAAISDGCKRCLAANTASPFSCVFPGAKDYVFDGRNGLALFSRLPLRARPEFTAFDTLLVRRGAISAQIGDTLVHCTHLTADLSATVPYPKGRAFTGWATEQAAQLSRIVAKDKPGQCSVLLGDLNNGLGQDGLKAELADNYSAILAAGYEERWAPQRCTWCTDNPLAGTKVNQRYDHILFRGCSALGTPSYSRIMDQPITVVGDDGQSIDTRLSDHYGVMVQIAPRR